MQSTKGSIEKVLITGGTGSLGQALVRELLVSPAPPKIVVYSRGEFAQFEMEQRFPTVQYCLGDVRDYDRLRYAMQGCSRVIHSAALKHVAKCERDPGEAVKTNINGARNVIRAARRERVAKVLAISTDKAVNPYNLYGATKLAADKLFCAASLEYCPACAVIRWGNFFDSRGSVAPIFRAAKEKQAGFVHVHDLRMTRFHVTLGQAARITLRILDVFYGGEIFVPKMPSYYLVALAHAIYPGAELKETGRLPGEKIHEELLLPGDAPMTRDYGDYYSTHPGFNPNRTGGGKRVPKDFHYTSEDNTEWVTEF